MSRDDRAPSDLILERSLLGAIAAMLPLPLFDDVLLRRSRRALLAELARRADLRLDPASLTVLATDPGRSPLASAGFGLVARTLQRATMPLRILERGRGALVTFQLATLLDHYARQHHRGLDLDVARAKRLRASMDEAIRLTPLSLGALRHPDEYAQALRASFDSLWATKALA